MTFKEFETWCNERACDGCWSMLTAIVFNDIRERAKLRKEIKEKERENLSLSRLVEERNMQLQKAKDEIHPLNGIHGYDGR